ncbi:MAG: hypothetical protein M3341_09550 [Actinomycetota bacterium]|nr:hypothetical protein [Actinomycetota bacterium]
MSLPLRGDATPTAGTIFEMGRAPMSIRVLIAEVRRSPTHNALQQPLGVNFRGT